MKIYNEKCTVLGQQPLHLHTVVIKCLSGPETLHLTGFRPTQSVSRKSVLFYMILNLICVCVWFSNSDWTSESTQLEDTDQQFEDDLKTVKVKYSTAHIWEECLSPCRSRGFWLCIF